jgi:hypothetical protein
LRRGTFRYAGFLSHINQSNFTLIHYYSLTKGVNGVFESPNSR